MGADFSPEEAHSVGRAYTRAGLQRSETAVLQPYRSCPFLCYSWWGEDLAIAE